MPRKTVSLKEAADILAAQGIDIRMGTFSSYESFQSYWDIHYRTMTGKIRRIDDPVAPFLADDLEKIFNN